MEFYDVILKRRSIRAYKKQEIPDDVFERILEAARLAPSASNLQPWKFIIIKEPEHKKDIALLCKQKMWIAEASIIIAGVGINPEYQMGSGQSAYQIDISTAFAQISLAAVNEGLGVCWIGSFLMDECKRYLGIPEKYPPVGFLAIGYPDEIPGPKERKRLEEIICREKWAE